MYTLWTIMISHFPLYIWLSLLGERISNLCIFSVSDCFSGSVRKCDGWHVQGGLYFNDLQVKAAICYMYFMMAENSLHGLEPYLISLLS